MAPQSQGLGLLALSALPSRCMVSMLKVTLRSKMAAAAPVSMSEFQKAGKTTESWGRSLPTFLSPL